MKKLFIVCSGVLLTLCSAPPAPIVQEMLPPLFIPFESQDSICLFEAFGEATLSGNGQKLSAHIEVKWKNDNDFKVEFFSPFGGLVGSITPQRTGYWNIAIGGTIVKKLPRDTVEMADGVIKYPFTYAQFMRVLRGVLFDEKIFKKSPDSLSFDAKKAQCIWKNDALGDDTFDVTAIISRKHSCVTDVVYSVNRALEWRLVYSSFIDGAPKEIRLSGANNNYFYVNYEKTFRRRGVECREER
jgi:hypothetical protein